MNRISKVLVVVLLFLSAVTLYASPYVLVHASDPHFLSPSLVEDYGFVEEVALVSDGKDLHQTHLILDAFLSDMLSLKPDAVLISGDLTLNGAKESHMEMARRLRPLLDAGIRVLVISGNHDVNHTAYHFLKDGAMALEKTGGQFFEDTWWDFGYGDALYQDAWSNSYIAELTDKLWLVALDSNTGSTGTVRSTTINWLVEHLQEAQEKGILVLSTTHQNILLHNERFTFGYLLNNAETMAGIYQEYGVALNLSGHLHIQHIATEGGLSEITTSSLVDTPLQYGVLTIDGDSLTYATREIGDADLQRSAREVFDACTANNLKGALDNLDAEDAALLLDSAKSMNRGYFKGALDPVNQEALDLWKKHEEISFGHYLLSILKDSQKDYRYWSNQN